MEVMTEYAPGNDPLSSPRLSILPSPVVASSKDEASVHPNLTCTKQPVCRRRGPVSSELEVIPGYTSDNHPFVPAGYLSRDWPPPVLPSSFSSAGAPGPRHRRSRSSHLSFDSSVPSLSPAPSLWDMGEEEVAGTADAGREKLLEANMTEQDELTDLKPPAVQASGRWRNIGAASPSTMARTLLEPTAKRATPDLGSSSKSLAPLVPGLIAKAEVLGAEAIRAQDDLSNSRQKGSFEETTRDLEEAEQRLAVVARRLKAMAQSVRSGVSGDDRAWAAVEGISSQLESAAKSFTCISEHLESIISELQGAAEDGTPVGSGHGPVAEPGAEAGGAAEVPAAVSADMASGVGAEASIAKAAAAMRLAASEGSATHASTVQPLPLVLSPGSPAAAAKLTCPLPVSLSLQNSGTSKSPTEHLTLSMSLNRSCTAGETNDASAPDKGVNPRSASRSSTARGKRHGSLSTDSLVPRSISARKASPARFSSPLGLRTPAGKSSMQASRSKSPRVRGCKSDARQASEGSSMVSPLRVRRGPDEEAAGKQSTSKSPLRPRSIFGSQELPAVLTPKLLSRSEQTESPVPGRLPGVPTRHRRMHSFDVQPMRIKELAAPDTSGSKKSGHWDFLDGCLVAGDALETCSSTNGPGSPSIAPPGKCLYLHHKGRRVALDLQ